MTLLGIDVSHHQGVIDFAAVKRAGYSFVVLKATEGVGYTDPMFAANRAKARAAGLIVGIYHFARAGSPAAEADYFCSVIGSLNVGELVFLDWEVPAPNPPAWCLAWLTPVSNRLRVKPPLYMNASTEASYNWSPIVAGDYGLWLAKYDGNQTPPAAAHWPVVAMKQFTSGGTVPGIPGQVDLDVFFGSAAALARYGKQPPPPAPVPVDILEEIAAMTPADRAKLVDDIATAAAAKVWNSTFTAAGGPLKGQKVKGGKALDDIWHGVTDTGGGLFALVKRIVAKLGA